VQPIEGESKDKALAAVSEELHEDMHAVSALVDQLKQLVLGDFDLPDKAVIGYLDDFDKRLTKLEKKKA
jgi:hypothetical protein